jgi:hypothetical protein
MMGASIELHGDDPLGYHHSSSHTQLEIDVLIDVHYISAIGERWGEDIGLKHILS